MKTETEIQSLITCLEDCYESIIAEIDNPRETRSTLQNALQTMSARLDALKWVMGYPSKIARQLEAADIDLTLAENKNGNVINNHSR